VSTDTQTFASAEVALAWLRETAGRVCREVYPGAPLSAFLTTTAGVRGNPFTPQDLYVFLRRRDLGDEDRAKLAAAVSMLRSVGVPVGDQGASRGRSSLWPR